MGLKGRTGGGATKVVAAAGGGGGGGGCLINLAETPGDGCTWPPSLLKFR
jgi:hypothetical protein